MKDDRTTATAAIIVDPLAGERDAGRAFLVVHQGEGPRASGRVVPLPDGIEVVFGRLPSSAVEIDDDMVSRRHCAVLRRGAEIVVRDLESRNGTRVNGVVIDGPTRVSAGDEIAVGPVQAVVGVTTGLRLRTRCGSAADLDERLSAEVDRAVRYRRPLGLAMIRLDGPPHVAGDAVDRLARILRRMDYLAQYGPDEYAVVLPEADRTATEAAARRLAAEARTSGRGHGGLAIHAGLAVCPDDGATAGELISRARAALRAARTRGGNHLVAEAPADEVAPGANVVSVDPLMKRVFAMARRVAETPITVLILGETGVGKEIIATAIHQQSPRAGGPFQALNCSALPETLLESELFGHEKGAFTGADRRKAGYFEAASGGTLFLDEIGEMPPGVQAKLLRVLEQRVVTRVGGTQAMNIDVRVICATNRDLEVEVKRGRFREDLYFRVGAFTMVVPPLRDRRSEILPLAQHFARQFALELGQPPPAFTPAARAAMEAYDWPGNVRELRNAVERAVVLEPRGTIDLEDLPERVARGGGIEPGDEPGMPVRHRVAEVEKGAVVDALAACAGNQTHAARRLGISRFALIRLMKKYELG